MQSRSSASEEGLSASQSSDYEDHEELQNIQQQVTVHAVSWICISQTNMWINNSNNVNNYLAVNYF